MTFTVTENLIQVYKSVLELGKTHYFNLIFHKGFVLIYSEVKEMFKLNILRTDCDGSEAYRMPVEVMSVLMKPGTVDIKEVEEKDHIILNISHYTGSTCDIDMSVAKEYCKEKDLINDYFKLLMKVSKDETGEYTKYTSSRDYALGLAACKILDSDSKIKGITYSGGIGYIVNQMYYCYFKTDNVFDMSISKDALRGLLKFTNGKSSYILMSYKGMNICIIGTSLFGWRKVRSYDMKLDADFDFSDKVSINYMDTLSIITSIDSDIKDFNFYIKDNLIVLNTLSVRYRIPLISDKCDITKVNIPFKLFKSLMNQAGFVNEITYNNNMVKFKINCFDSTLNFVFGRGGADCGSNTN